MDASLTELLIQYLMIDVRQDEVIAVLMIFEELSTYGDCFLVKRIRLILFKLCVILDFAQVRKPLNILGNLFVAFHLREMVRFIRQKCGWCVRFIVKKSAIVECSFSCRVD